MIEKPDKKPDIDKIIELTEELRDYLYSINCYGSVLVRVGCIEITTGDNIFLLPIVPRKKESDTE